MFTVSEAQAKGAYQVLQQEGIPILYAPAEVAASTLSEFQNKSNSNFSF